MEWDGIGLPPVGTDCEIYWAAGEYVPVRIVGHDEDRAVFRLCQGLQKGTYGAASAGERTFRPMRTAEQMAREAYVTEMMRRFALIGQPGVDWQALFEQMYDAGLRFPIRVRP